MIKIKILNEDYKWYDNSDDSSKNELLYPKIVKVGVLQSGQRVYVEPQSSGNDSTFKFLVDANYGLPDSVKNNNNISRDIQQIGFCKIGPISPNIVKMTDFQLDKKYRTRSSNKAILRIIFKLAEIKFPQSKVLLMKLGSLFAEDITKGFDVTYFIQPDFEIHNPDKDLCKTNKLGLTKSFTMQEIVDKFQLTSEDTKELLDFNLGIDPRSYVMVVKRGDAKTKHALHTSSGWTKLFLKLR